MKRGAQANIRASGSVGLCPLCGTVSRRVHSRYRRRVTDLPLSGRIVQLLVVARRFRCDAVLCGRQIFTERFAEDGVTGFAMELLDVPEEQRVDLQPGMYCTFVNGALPLHKTIWTTHSRDLARAKAARLYQVMGWDHK